MSEPKYISYARSQIGVTEIKGMKTSPTIATWLDQLGAWWTDDEAPWCGVFVAACLQRFNYEIPKLYMRALAWRDWGVKIETPCIGCVAIITRAGGGHVFFPVSQDHAGRIYGLGGNQGNCVSIAAFPPSRLVDVEYRLPAEFWLNHQPLPIIVSQAANSMSEA